MGMWGDSKDPRSRATGGFRTDTRSQSVVIGSILMFTLIVGLLGILQLFVVPQQNADVELNHDSMVKDDFTELHSGLLNAVENNRDHTETFHLGVEYPARFILLNPPDPQGALSTEELGPITDTVEDTDGTEWNVGEDVCGLPSGENTKHLVQEGNYNELQDPGFYAYENSVTHHSIGDDSDQRFIDPNQDFIQDQTIHLRPLVGEDISVSKVGSHSVSFKTNETGRISVNANEVLTLPTAMSKSQWEEIVDGSDLVVNDVSGGEVDLETQDSLILVCTPIGAETSPETDVDSDAEVGTGPGNESFINPVGEGALQYEGTTKIDGSNFDADFFSNNEDHDIVKVRVAAIGSPGKNGESILLEKETTENLTIGGSFHTVDTTWEWDKDERLPVRISDEDPATVTLNSNTELTIQFETSSGEILTYVVEIPAQGN